MSVNVKPTSRATRCMLRFQEAVEGGALPFGVQATENLWTLDGGRTIGWELADQLGAESVDNVLVQVGGGALLTSCAIGLLEGAALGPLERVPRVWAVQAQQCAPFEKAWSQIPAAASVDERLSLAEQQAEQLMTPWPDPSSAATGILDDVTYDWLGVARALLLTGGSSVLASEDDIDSANQRVRAAGYNADHTGSAGYAGLLASGSPPRHHLPHRQFCRAHHRYPPLTHQGWRQLRLRPTTTQHRHSLISSSSATLVLLIKFAAHYFTNVERGVSDVERAGCRAAT